MAAYPATANLQPSFGEELDSSWIDLVFRNKDPGREGLFGIIVQHWDNSLDDDGTGVDPLIHKVNRTAGELRSVLYGLSLSMQTRKGRQECRMDIHDPMCVRLNKQRTQQTHIAC